MSTEQKPDTSKPKTNDPTKSAAKTGKSAGGQRQAVPNTLPGHRETEPSVDKE
jgi:hypothetical protein